MYQVQTRHCLLGALPRWPSDDACHGPASWEWLTQLDKRLTVFECPCIPAQQLYVPMLACWFSSGVTHSSNAMCAC